MKALLDTHTFLWWNSNDPLLSPTARQLIADPQNEIFLSVASGWEIAIKAGKGKLILPEPPEQYVPKRVSHYRFTVLAIQMSHVLQVALLPNHHSDPFDRLLIAQSLVENIPLLSADSEFSNYPIKTVW
jgi:PIN domain nuclease of toxin-antitoxin system